MTFNFAIIAEYLPTLLIGLVSTIKFVSLAIIFGLIIGFFLSLCRSSKNKVIYWCSTIFIDIFRGTPVLVQLFWFYYCFPLFIGIQLEGFTSVCLSLTLYFSAISCESFRAGIKSIDSQQYDACIALGMNSIQRAIFVILPQSVLRSIPNLASNIVSLFKESALISAVGLAELMYVSQNIANSTGKPIEILTASAALYFIVAFPFTRLAMFAEKKLNKIISV